MSGDLAEGWAAVSLGSITTKIGSGATPRGGSTAYAASGIPLIRSQNVYFDAFRDEGLVFLNREQASALDGVRVEKGDVLLNITGASIGRACVAPARMHDARVNQHVAIIRPRAGTIEPLLLAMYLESPTIQIRINTEEYGVTRQALTKGWIEELHVPVPPPNEQCRIIEKVEVLLEQVRRAKERLERVPLILKTFRQSVLAAACSGELVDPVAQAGVAEDELAAIREEVAARKRDDTRGRRRRTSEPSVPDALTKDLPEHWARCRIGDIFDISYGLSEPLRKTSPETAGDVPILSMANITPWGDWKLSALKFFEVPGSDLPKLALRPGDLLFNWRNSPNWIGKTARFDLHDRLYVNASFLLRLRPCRPGTYEKFSRLYFNYLRLAGYFENASRAAVSQSNFNASEVRVIDAPFPPLEEQAEIVRQVDRLFALAGAIEHRVQTATARAERLPQAILSKAFSGELVPTEAELARADGRTYETAEQLLEKVRRVNADVASEASGVRRATGDDPRRRKTAAR
jgi:type I restriction enzyme S subunit